MCGLKLKYIKAGGVYYRPTKEEGLSSKIINGVKYYDAITITKLSFGRWKVEGYKSTLYEDDNVLILYPSGIEEIRYFK